jgi:hypothetical protein
VDPDTAEPVAQAPNPRDAVALTLLCLFLFFAAAGGFTVWDGPAFGVGCLISAAASLIASLIVGGE